MSGPLYLKRIALMQFRSFEKLDVELASEPGILIVHGSNGLGKSSLFNALEWTLTDQIDHFRAAKGVKKAGSYLCRWRKGDLGPTSAEMTFSDESIIKRSLASAKGTKSVLGGTVENITAFLRTPEWTQSITSLDQYLLMTHILGQTTASRLIYRTDEEMFNILKEVVQSDSIETIAYALHGKGNTTASRAFNHLVERLDGEAAKLRELLAQEAQLWEGVQTSGAIDEPEGLALAAQIIALLDRAVPSDGPEVPLRVPSVTGPGIDALQTRLDEALKAQRQRATTIERAQQLVDDVRRNQTAIAEATAMLTDSNRQLFEFSPKLISTREDLADRETATAGSLQSLASVRSVHTRLVDLRRLLGRLESGRYKENATKEQLANAERAMVEFEDGLAKAERHRHIVARLDVRIAEVDEALVATRERKLRIQQWIEADDHTSSKSVALKRLEAERPAVNATVGEAELAVEHARVIEAAQARLTADLEASVNSISAAVSDIAINLIPDACDCPVCATHFEQAGVLQERAATAATRLAPTLLGQQQAHRSAQSALKFAHAQLDALRQTQDQIRILRSQIDTERNVNRDRLERIGLAVHGNSPLAQVQALQHESNGQIALLVRRRARRLRWRERLSIGEDTDLSTVVSLARRRRDEAQRAREVAARQLFEISSDVESLTVEVGLLGQSLLKAASPDVMAVQTTIDAAEIQLKHAQDAFDEARNAQEEANTRLATLRSSKAAMDARRGELGEALAKAVAALSHSRDEWKALGWDEDLEPDQECIDDAIAKATRDAGEIREAEDLLRRLRAGREAKLRQESHKDALDRLWTALDAPPQADRVQLRATAEQRALDKQRDADHTRATKEIARAASADIYVELESFNADYIEPLDQLAKHINQAILCDPEAGIDLHVRDRKIVQSASRTRNVPADIGEIDPALVLSEGQMAALAVSMLCAASLTYPWSRWRALVLDDPLQHNDAIHAAAFADLVGNLVLDQGYQVLMSTHDLAQAQFLQRKFDSRRIPCAALQLFGQGRDGVESQLRPARFTMPLAQGG